MTDTDGKCFTFKWMVKNASYCWHEKGEILESPPFIIKALEETEWCLFMYPKGYQNSSSLLYLKRKDNDKGPNEIHLDFQLSILGESGSPVKAFNRNRRPFYKDSSYGGSDIPTWEEIFLLNKSSFLPNNTLTVCCRMWKIDEEFPMPMQCFAWTSIVLEPRSFFIEIKNFRNLGQHKDKGTVIKSTINIENLKLKFFITEGLEGDETMFFELISTNKKTRLFKFKLFIINSSGQIVECSRDECGFYHKRNKTWLFPLTVTKGKLMSNQSLYLMDDTLTLKCDCSFSNGDLYEQISEVDNNIIFSKSLPSINLNTSEGTAAMTKSALEALKSLYTDQILCDVKLRTEKETFPAHRNILSARSPVFRTMFTSDMKEKSSQFVDIPDVDADILRCMLRYVYTDSLEDLQFQSAYQLYAAANKYQILDLRNKCSIFLRGELTRSNACDVLVLADMHQDKDLKTDVQNFIVKEGKSMFTSDEWKDFLKENIQLAAETMLYKCIKE